MQTSAFEVYVLGLLAVLERLPIPIAISFDRQCERVQGNRAFRRLIGLGTTENASLSAANRRTLRYRFLCDDEPVALDDLPLRRAAREGVEVIDMPLQLEREDGSLRAIQTSAWPLRDASGVVEGSIVVMLDASERSEAEKRADRAMHALRESEQRYRLITEAMPQFVWLDAADGSAVYSNRRWLEYTGLTQEQNAGFGWEQVVHPDDALRLQGERERTLRTGDVYEGECRYRGKDGKYRWFLFRSIPVRDENGEITSWLGTATDIDQQKRAQAQQTFFALASDLLSSTLDVGTTLERIASLAIESLGTWCQIDVPGDDGKLRVAVVGHQNVEKKRLLQRLVGQAIYADDAAFGPPRVHTDGRPQLLARIDEDIVQTVIPDPDVRDIYQTVGYSGGLIVPLRSGLNVLGVLGIASDDPSRLYTDFDVTTAMELGRRGGAALENARSYAREHRVAATLQNALLPRSLPALAGLRFYSAYASQMFEQGEAVGGDWYDAFILPGDRVAISMGDVAGHGIAAAVTMSTVRQALRATAFGSRSPRQILSRANAMIALEQRVSMVTALFGIYDLHAHTFTYALAGHPRPLYVDDLGRFRALPGAGPPLGDAFDDILVTEQTVPIDVPGTLVFYTDGLIEYGRDLVGATARLKTVLRERYFLSDANPAQSIIDRILDGPQRDDIAVLVMRTEDINARQLHIALPARGQSAPLLRERLKRFASEHGKEGEELFAVLNAAGEAVANAIEHAYTNGEGPVTVKAWPNHGTFHVEISDEGRWREPASSDAARGRGRQIMSRLAREVEIDPKPGGTVVRLTF